MNPFLYIEKKGEGANNHGDDVAAHHSPNEANNTLNRNWTEHEISYFRLLNRVFGTLNGFFRIISAIAFYFDIRCVCVCVVGVAVACYWVKYVHMFTDSLLDFRVGATAATAALTTTKRSPCVCVFVRCILCRSNSSAGCS